MLKVSNQKGYETIRYSAPAMVRKMKADLKKEYGLEGPWFCSVRPPKNALYPENCTVGLDKSPTGKANGWRKYLIFQKQFGLTFQNTVINPNIRPRLTPSSYRRHNILVNNGKPLTFNDLTRVPASRSGTGKDEYQYLIDCSEAFYHPTQPLSGDLFTVSVSRPVLELPDGKTPGKRARDKMINKLKGKILFVKKAEFVKDRSGKNTPILRLTIDPDKKGKHFITVGTGSLHDNIIINYVGR